MISIGLIIFVLSITTIYTIAAIISYKIAKLTYMPASRAFALVASITSAALLWIYLLLGLFNLFGLHDILNTTSIFVLLIYLYLGPVTALLESVFIYRSIKKLFETGREVK